MLASNLLKLFQIPQRKKSDDFFLPEFLTIEALFLLILVSELFVFVVVLTVSDLPNIAWQRLSLISLFVMWVVLCSAIILSLLRPRLKRLKVFHAIALSYSLIQLVTIVFTIGTQFLVTDYSGWQVLRNLVISLIMSGIVLRYFYLRHQLRRQEQTSLQAKIDALQSRIRPHFLFNSMNIITSLISTRPKLAEQVVEDLSELFRASLSRDKNQVPLAQEVALCKRYENIEKLRLGERLEVQWSIAEDIPESVTIPLLTIQPLLENAIYHGIQPMVEGGLVSVRINYEHRSLHIIMSNPYEDHYNHRQGHGIALQNIRDRLQTLYGASATLQTRKENGQFITQLSYYLSLLD